MSETIYAYSIASDTENAKVDSPKLVTEITNSSITISLTRIDTSGDDLSIIFDSAISGGEETTLDGLVAAHDGEPVVEPSAPVDTDGAPLVRTKITQSGWHFQLQAVEFTTAKLNSVYNADDEESDLGFATVKFYDDQDDELEDPTQIELTTNCVKTVIDWEADHDIEVIGGFFEQALNPATDVRMWITAIPDLTVAQGGSIPFVQGGLNLKYLSGKIDIDGKTPKLMPYNATYHTNKFRITLRHGAGVQHSAMVLFKLFRLNE